MMTLVEALLKHASDDPDELALRFLHEGETRGRVTHWSWSELAMRVTSTATWLHEIGLQRGDRALLMYPEGLDFAQAFLGCMVAGIIPVPVATQAAHPGQGMKLLSGIARVCAPRVALSSSAFASRVAPAMTKHLGELRLEETDTIEVEERAWRGPLPTLDEIAFLQFTSGSTSAPKGVVITHGNISAHQQIVGETHRIHDQTHMISWLPTHHDMGLAGDFMMAVWSGRPLTMMAPQHFIERPMRWLEAISGQPGARSGGPNFAFALVVRKLEREAMQWLDLSTWETAHCGAEPIRRAVLQAFAEALEPAGFDPSAFSLCYGMAEATLYVCDVRPWREGFAEDAVELDGFTVSGTTDGAIEIAIVDDEGARVPDGVEGEIWLRGPSIAAGYWENPETTKAIFGARVRGDDGGSWLRTGDLGRAVDGLLYPTGRIKDLIIWRGQNIYPQDIEYAVEGAHAALRPGCSAAFAVETEDGSEGIGLAAEVRREAVDAPELLNEIMQSIRRAIGAEFGVPIAALWLLPPRALLKTTSGKVMRAANRAAIQDGSHRVLLSSTSRMSVPSEEDVMSEVLRWVSSASGLPSDRISPDTPLRDLGIDSVCMVELRDHLQARFESSFQMKQLGRDPTLASVCALMRGRPLETGPNHSTNQGARESDHDPAGQRAAVLPSLSWMRKR